MWWKIIVEIILVLGLLATGTPFWVCARSRGHFDKFMRNQNALKQLFERMNRGAIITSASVIEPVFGSFAGNIATIDKIHFSVMRKTRNLTFIAIIILLIISYWLGVGFFTSNLLLFLLLGVGDISGSSKENSSKHVVELVGNIYKWNTVNPKDCSEYCCNKYPILKNLYHLISAL